ncbi:MAG: biopolymer transporter ExbD [Myxococcota bacterium]
MSRLTRRRESEELGEPEILPMMNVLFMLVMVLMGMSAFLPIGVIEVQAPQLGGSGGAASAKPDLNLTIMILKSGINLSVGGAMLRGEAGPLFPAIEKGGRQTYDFDALAAKLEQIKLQYPGEKRVIIMADPDTIYDDITHVMDAARISRTGQIMFDEVAFVPGIME